MRQLVGAGVVCLGLAIPSMALAQSSAGSGGPVGEQEDWPCPGCLFGTPENYDPTQPTPLLVVFHGDEGAPSYIYGSYYGSNWQGPGPAFEQGFLVLGLQCPVEHGCDLANPDGDPSWWRWRGSDYYVEEWVGEQIDAVEAAYDVDLRRVYTGSFSGGSSFIRAYGFEHADRFAGLLIGGGGGTPARECLGGCQIPVFISIGSADYLYDLAQDTRTYAEECGHELYYSEHPGVEHTIIDEDLPIALTWLLERPHLCIEPTVPDPDPPAGGAGGTTGTGGGGGTTEPPTGSGGSTTEPPIGAGGATTQPPTGSAGSGDVTPSGSDDSADEEGGCGCRVGGAGGGSAWLLALGAVVVGAVRRRRRK